MKRPARFAALLFALLGLYPVFLSSYSLLWCPLLFLLAGILLVVDANRVYKSLGIICLSINVYVVYLMVSIEC
ncbi:hypothetical protein [Hymenobacter armeniacus]|uniref:Uncharacterized protein n=1 Tax=Hymenobacter armeniacus TaxID=2771358 RepID=A0ABR8JYQ5_9BACT|nr:hypothetical protein [Hymenobacter armeniacus]MBD2723775.1 hypothetical protein [Hymenobacter armeniacus]